MKGIKFWLLRLIIVAVIVIFAIIPTMYFFARIADPAFRDGAMANWFATMIGAIVGILIALEINRYQQETQEKRERQVQEREKSARKTKILTLIRGELELNRQILFSTIEKQRIHPKVVPLTGMKDDLWNAFSASGELQWIDDLELLDSISTAYYYIRRIIPLEEKYFEPLFSLKLVSDTGPEGSYGGERIVRNLASIRPDALRAVEQTLEEIEKHLSGSANRAEDNSKQSSTPDLTMSLSADKGHILH